MLKDEFVENFNKLWTSNFVRKSMVQLGDRVLDHTKHLLSFSAENYVPETNEDFLLTKNDNHDD